MPWSSPGLMRSGAQPLLRMLEIFAPICMRGSMIRFMGRLFSDSSPERTDSNVCPARIPESRRVVVPLFPVSSISDGVASPWSPFPCMMTEVSFSSISMPRERKHRMVARQSAPVRKCCTSVVPSAIEPNITQRWETDLSPGTVIFPFNPLILHNSMILVPFCICSK